MSAVMLFLGYGYTAQHLAPHLTGFQIRATARGADKRAALTAAGIRPVSLSADDLSATTHLLVSAPPDAHGDPFVPHLPPLPHLRWAGYLSATSVYGDHQGGWVDETTPPSPSGPRGLQRLHAEQQWQALNLPLHIFRLSGIYGPARTVLDELRSGQARRVDKPGQFFSRIHVDDIVQTLLASIQKPNSGTIYTLSDDEPCSSAEVMAYGAQLLGLAPPPLVRFEDANLSPMAQSFYADNRRIRNDRIKSELGIRLKFPTYREGLRACLTG